LLVFDGDKPVATVDVATENEGFRWVSSSGETFARALVDALTEAELANIATEESEFALVRVPQVGLALVCFPALAMYLPVRLPHLDAWLPTGVYAEAATAEIGSSLLQP
jgi:hypothetical protein